MCSQIFSLSYFYYIFTMTGRGKISKGAIAMVTPKKRSRRATKRLQSPPIGSSPLQEPVNDLDMSGHEVGTQKDTLARVMHIFALISPAHLRPRNKA